ncbi:MAG: helix-turn-helix domain-containing protein [Candidatus Omnitrophota bacterium]
MKAEKIREAKELRRRGWSVRAIAQRIHCSKSSVSIWVRGIPLTTQQIERLKLA